ncbi:MAG: hypothetical protein ACI89L_000036 [Phycisphaerales bacterium]|jgi:hypothetical protein
MAATTAATRGVTLVLVTLSLTACASHRAPAVASQAENQAAFEYLRDLEGPWVVDGGAEGTFGWEFDITSKGGVILERLKVGTPTEMTTVYHLEDSALVASHFCQLGNQPRLLAVDSQADGDLHFDCDGDVGSAESHNELHMHGVHFKKQGDSVRIWMDMVKDGEIAFETSYTLVRASP